MKNFKNQIVRLKWSSIGSGSIALGKLVMALMTLSIFLAVNSFYTAIIGYGKYQSALGIEKNDEKYYKKIGTLIIFASLTYLIYSFHMFFTKEENHYGRMEAIGIATIAFVELGVNIFGIIRANLKKNLMHQAAKLLNLASALISLVLTQTAILSFTSQENHSVSNMISALLFSGITLIIGLWMRFRRLKNTIAPSE